MSTKEITIRGSFGYFDVELLYRVMIFTVVFMMGIICGMYAMPKRTVLMERRETVHKANAIVAQSNMELISAIDFPLEPIENELAPEILTTTVEVKNPEILTTTTGVNESEMLVEPEKIITSEEDIIETIPVKLSYNGSLRNDYCVGSIIDVSTLEIILDEKIIPTNDCVVEGMDTSVPGEHIIKITYEEYSVEIPYNVVDYTVVLHGAGEDKTYSLINYELDTNVIGVPVRLGKDFTGWYRDETCTIPFVSALPGETALELYAGWSDFDKFVCDDAGYITGHTGGYGSITDGLLNLTAHPSCIGVRADAFVNLEEFVTDIYIPANITHIESGAFDCLPYVFYIYAHPDNPIYTSDNGILYTKDMSTVVAYPSCR